MGGYPAGWAGSCSPSMTTATAVPSRTSSKTSLGGEPNAMPTSLRCQDQPLDALAGNQVTFGRGRMTDLPDNQRTRQNNSGRPMAIAAITLDRRKPSWVDFTALMNWAEQRGIRLDYIRPGKPQQNAYIECYNRTVRYDWLGQYLFSSITEVQKFATRWLWIYNHERPNMALGGMTGRKYSLLEKFELARKWSATRPSDQSRFPTSPMWSI